MARRKRTTPRQTRDKGQISLDLPNHFNRLLPSILPTWAHTRWYDAEVWRGIVARQPFAVACREALISNYLALDWKIEARDSEQRDELKKDIKDHTKFIEHTGEYDYAEQVEWLGKDLLDLSFGGAAEIGRLGDAPDGKVVWMELLDAGTLFPTLSKDWPVGQVLKEAIEKPVYFPKHRIDRIYMSPITDIHFKGWGLSPPQKIFLAIQLLNRGDTYYANLLLDTPEAGILDLMDMEEQSAKEWLKAWREEITGIDGFKVPILYAHDTAAKWIPFGRPPTDLMFDRITLRYASLTTAGYGVTLSDIGISSTASGGETLSGTIRQERQTKRTGFAKFKRKMIQFYNFILPDTLEYKVVDLDDEQSVAKGRALLSHATGWNQLVEVGMFSPQEARQQMIADGLITISVPEKIPPDAVPRNGNGDERPGSLGRPIPASDGGHGEVVPRSDLEIENFRPRKLVSSIIEPLV